MRKGNRSAQKIVKNWLTRFKNTKIEIWQYILDCGSPNWQRKLNLKKKSPKLDVYGLN